MRFGSTNSSLIVQVAVSGTPDNFTVDFSYGGSTPPARRPGDLVDRFGTIDFMNLPLDPRYNQAVDLIFVVSGQIVDGGKAHDVLFLSPTTNSFVIKYLLRFPRREFRRLPLGWFALRRLARRLRTDPRKVLPLTDANDDGELYQYGLIFVADGLPNWRGQLDPAIVNRGS